jgi:serine phosphatase RsbU (regulator of sigma subunit)
MRPVAEPTVPEGSDQVVRSMLGAPAAMPAAELGRVVDLVVAGSGASSGQVLVADYALISLRALGDDGPVGEPQLIEGTLAGRALATGTVVASAETRTVWVPLTEGAERLGVLELIDLSWSDDVERALVPLARVIVLVLVSIRRYTDSVVRSRRSEPLSPAAELQWDLLPPLTFETERFSLSGILEPAYSIGGDSFDYAVNADRVEFAIVDAVGHGMAAVMMSVAAINGLRNARRERAGLDAAYLRTGEIIASQFPRGAFVTAQLASLAADSGVLTWLNAGHPLPLLVRNGSYVGELPCRPSWPLGLRGSVKEVATARLQPGDRVLFFTDGVIETGIREGRAFGLPRLADFLVRATVSGVSPAETVRRLSASVVAHNGAGLSDDATLLLIEYHGAESQSGSELLPAG